MHDHGESGGASQQMVKGDQTLAFARHDPTTRPPTGDATTQQVRAWTEMALGRQPLLHPWPHTSPAPKRIRKARRTRGRRSTAFRKRRFVSCISTCVQYFFSQEKKGRGGKKLLPVQELAHRLADKATRLLPPVHQERSRTGPQMTAKRPHSLQTGFYCSRTSSVCKDLRSSTGTGTIARHIQFWFWKIPR